MTERASIRDVARLASVSRQTVSRALNRPASVGPETLSRVREAVAALGYRPNLAARSLKTRQSGSLGVVVNPMSWFALDQEVARLGHLAAEQGLALQVAATYDDSYDGTNAAVRGLLDQRVEGLFVMSPLDRGLDVALSVAADLPVVIVQSGAHIDSSPAGTVDADQAAGVRLLVDHLVAQGHHRIDVVYVHDPEPGHLAQVVGEAGPELTRLRDAGVIRAWGLGSGDLAAHHRALDAGPDLLMVAGRYTLLEQSAALPLLDQALAQGAGVVACGVFASGILATDHPDHTATYEYAPAPAAVVARARRAAAVCAAYVVTEFSEADNAGSLLVDTVAP